MPTGSIPDTYSILLVDPCPVVEVGLNEMLAGSPFVLVDRVDSIPAAKRCLTLQEIHLVLSEYCFEGTIDELWRMVRREQIPLLLYSSRFHPALITRMARSGVSGRIDKRVDKKTLCELLTRATRGERIWTRQELRKAAGAQVAASLVDCVGFPLTDRELDVLRCLAAGNSNRKIAELLNVGFETAKEHVQHVIGKLGVSDRTQAAILAQRNGLL